MFAYTVACDFEVEQTARHWVQWLRDEHLSEVCAAGAVAAQVVWLDGAAPGGARCEARYLFTSRDDFKRYEHEHAPRLREEGLKRFPLILGLRYTRTTGEIMARYPA